MRAIQNASLSLHAWIHLFNGLNPLTHCPELSVLNSTALLPSFSHSFCWRMVLADSGDVADHVVEDKQLFLNDRQQRTD